MPAGTKLKQITTRAKALRKAKPGMSWHSAQRAAAAQLRGGRTHKTTGTKRKKATTHRKHTSTAVSKTRHHKKRTSMGRTTVITGHKRKKNKGWFGATSASTTQKAVQITKSAVGVGVGIVGTHMLLRPLEHKVIAMIKDPQINKYASKAMPFAEAFLGLGMMLFSKNKILQTVGMGIGSVGVGGIIRQTPLHMHSPAETVNGVGNYTQMRIPINGTIRGAIAGLIQQQGYTKTPVIGDMVTHTPTVGARYSTLNSSPVVGEYEDDDEQLFRSNIFRR